MLFVKPVYATCPVCVVTVGGGLFIAKKLGIDDFLISIWISGLNTAVAYLIAAKMRRKILNNPVILSAIFYLLTLFYFFTTKQIGHPGNLILGIDKISFGITIGLIIFILSVVIEKKLRFFNKGKVLFYYQKVIIPFLFLTLTTLIFKILFKL